MEEWSLEIHPLFYRHLVEQNTCYYPSQYMNATDGCRLAFFFFFFNIKRNHLCYCLLTSQQFYGGRYYPHFATENETQGYYSLRQQSGSPNF